MTINLSTIVASGNTSSMVGPINANFEKLEEAVSALQELSSTLSSNIDCNGYSLINAKLTDATQVSGGLSLQALVAKVLTLEAELAALKGK